MPSRTVFPRRGEVQYYAASDDFWRRFEVARRTNTYRWRALCLRAMLAIQGHTLLAFDINRARGEHAQNLQRVIRCGAKLPQASHIQIGITRDLLESAMANPHNAVIGKEKRRWAIKEIRRQLDAAEYAITKAALGAM
jgi:hypothetical protein